MTQTAQFLVVHTDAAPHADWSIETERLAHIGARFLPTTSASEDELIETTRHADVLCVTSARITRRVIEHLERCRAIIRYGVGFELPQAILWELLDDFILVGDDEIRAAIRLLLEKAHTPAEGAGAAPLAAALRLRERLAGRRAALVVSGGNLSMTQLQSIVGEVRS